MSRVLRHSLGALAALLVASQAVAQQGTDSPIQRDITVDGVFDDWEIVRTNPLNASRDAQGALVSCSLTQDRDCPIDNLDHDLAELAWTWNSQGAFVLARWHGTRGARRTLYLFLDDDANELMSDGEDVFVLELDGSDGTWTLEKHDYHHAALGGDPLVDAAGYADGHAMPGTMTFDEDILGEVGSARSGSIVEFSIPWDDPLVGVIGPGFFRASSFFDGSGGPGSAGLKDNIGGPDGRVGTTAFRDVRITPERVLGSAPGGVPQAVHRVENAGNVPDRINLTGLSSSGNDIAYYLDADGDGFAETHLGTDAGGDGVMSLPGDVLMSAGDSDADGVLDVGVLWLGQGVDVVVTDAISLTATGITESLRLAASHASAPAIRSEVTDTIRVGSVTIAPDGQRLGVAGDAAWYPHVVQNNGTSSAVVDLSFSSARNWLAAAFADPNADGDPSDALPLADTDSSGLADVRLFAGTSTTIFVRVAIPAGEPLAATDPLIVRAVHAGITTSTALDETTVSSPLELVPDHLAAAGDARYGAAGGSIYFAHRLTNARSASAVHDLSATSDLGWPVTFLSDPDGDGRPFDSEPLPGATGLVRGNGGVFSFLARVDVPAGSTIGDVNRVVITATARDNTSVTSEVSDDAVAAIVRVYEDQALTVNVLRAAPCTRLHAGASGLRPSRGGYRLSWHDGSGAVLRVLDVASDAAGECRDQLDLTAAEVGPGFRVEIQEWNGLAHDPLDVASFAVGDAVDVSGLVPAPSPLHFEDRTVSATAQVTNSAPDLSADGVTLRWVVLTADLSQYLQPSGDFAPYTGSEATGQDVMDVGPSATRGVRLDVPGTTFPGVGDHVVELWRQAGCAAESLEATATLMVVDDADGDGLHGDVEAAAGTDEHDVDSDDDGVGDFEDGVLDTDRDGAIDALDCDSDGDGILDGTESGVWTPPAGTDSTRGCFVADLSPLTQTDPKVADTDGGGVPDGFEDRDHDGRRDAGESDPLDAGDDAAQCRASTPPEVADLRVGHEGDVALLSWTSLADPCTNYRVLAADMLPTFQEVATGLLQAEYADAAPASGPRYYLIAARSPFGGDGPTGR